MHNQKLLEAISPWLEIIDSELSLDEVSVSSRPLSAGIWLVKNAIKEISGGSKENYFESEWFSIFMLVVIHWYREKYGEGLLKSNPSKIHCLVVFRDIPLLCEVPATTSKVEVESETAWLSFPDCLQPEEETPALFPAKPRLESLTEQERLNYWEAVRRVVGLSRSNHLHLMLFECTDELERLKNPDAMDWHSGVVNQLFAFFDCPIKAALKSIGDRFPNELCRRIVL